MDNPKDWYICNNPACRQPFKRKQDWQRHMEVHLGISFKCDFCNKGFTRKSSVIKHKEQCKKAPNSGAVHEEDGILLDMVPVVPVRLDITTMKLYSDSPPKAKFTRTAWVATNHGTASNKAIKILTKHDSTPEPKKPSDFSPRKLAEIKAKIKAPTIKQEFKRHTKPSDSLDPGEGTSSGILRIPTAPVKCSDTKPVKRSIPLADNTITSIVPLRSKDTAELSAITPSTSTSQAGIGKPSLKKVRFSLSETTTPTKAQYDPKAPHTETLPDFQHMDGPGGSPFISDPDVPLQTIWDVLDPPGPISPICSPELRDLPTEPNQIAVEIISKPASDPMDCIGFISDSDSEEETTKSPPALSTTSTKVPDEHPCVNEIILDIIGEISIINDISLREDLTKHQKALAKVCRILRRTSKKITK